MKFRVQANPKGGTCYQVIDDPNVTTEEQAVQKAIDNPNGWEHARPDKISNWSIKAYQR